MPADGGVDKVPNEGVGGRATLAMLSAVAGCAERG